MSRFLRVAALAAALVCVASPVRAFSLESAITDGCHERISLDALRAIRLAGPNAPAIAEDRALVADVPFSLPVEMRELAAATLLIGNRDNDLKGRGAGEVDQLTLVHGDPRFQREHCLRAREDDEPDGTARAIEACTGFIREKVADALEGLGAEGRPDPAQKAHVSVQLELRGQVDVELPRYWLRIGQAMHALQDGFSHTFRTPDRRRVRSALNWIEYVDREEVEARDGPIHRGELDQCVDVDELRQQNLAAATEASRLLLEVTLDPARDRAAKLAAVDELLATYFGVEQGCIEANGWCGSPERDYAVSASCGCDAIGARARSAAWIAAGLVVLAALARRRRWTAALFAVLLFTRTASAQEPEPEPAPTVPTPQEVADEHKERERKLKRWGIYAAGSGSITNPGLSGQLGGRFRLSERWTVGLDGEINGWYGVHTKAFRTGAFNGYLTAILRFPLRFASVNLRTTAQAGTSVMLIDLYGAPRGSVGFFLGLVPLGLEYKVASHLYLVLDALGVALPVPSLKGAPFAYPQYRTAFGVELAF